MHTATPSEPRSKNERTHLKLVVITPHFAPDVAPTGVVVTRLVEELAARGHTLDVLTSFPWYREHRVEAGYEGRSVRYEDTPWGRITRVNPFPATDKQRFVRRAAGYVAFSALAGALGLRGGKADGVLALSPPLTLGLTGWAVARRRRAPLVFNIQDVYPDVAIELDVLTRPSLIRVAKRLERFCYDRADAVTVLSDELRDNVADKIGRVDKVHVIPNFVDIERIVPGPRENSYRKEYELENKTVVMYAGNVGLSQSLDLLIHAASALTDEKDLVFVINGHGAARRDLQRRASGLPNVRFVEMQPETRLPEVLAAADLHVVPLKAGLARSSVPSKTYSILAAGRPLIASVDVGSEIAHIVERADAGLAVPPEDPEAFTKAIRSLVDAPDELTRMGASGRDFVERWASPAAIAEAYDDLFETLSP
jgi:colanic acid biosynthesis glycosyl transferase WcaI